MRASPTGRAARSKAGRWRMTPLGSPSRVADAHKRAYGSPPLLFRGGIQPGLSLRRLSLMTCPRRGAPLPAFGADGEVAEWSIVPHSKCGVRATVPWVRIPPSPPTTQLPETHWRRRSTDRRTRLCDGGKIVTANIDEFKCIRGLRLENRSSRHRKRTL